MRKYINTKDLEQKVLTYYNDGKSDSYIERILEFPSGTVYNFRKSLNLCSNRGKTADKKSKEISKLLKKGYTAKAISDKLGIGSWTLREYFRRNNMVSIFNVKRKFNYKLNNRQLSILCGILLGDGTIYAQANKTSNYTCKFIVRHGPKQLKYSKYIYDCFYKLNRNFTILKIKAHILNNKEIKEQYQSQVTLNSSSQMQNIYKLFYKNNKKIIPFEFLNRYYTKEGLAFHFMDDGCKTCDRSGNINGFIISMQSFSKNEVDKFSWFIFGKFHLDNTVILQKEKPIIRIKSNSVKTFINIVEPYIIESLKYKISPNKTS